MTGSEARVPVHLTTTCFGINRGWDCAIVIPAKDEAARISACLDAAALSIADAAPLVTGIVVVVNNTTDQTANIVAGWARQNDGSVVLIDCVFAPGDAGVGSARRLGLDAAASTVLSDGTLLTTDADTVVREDWVRQNILALEYADLICGTVVGLPAEALALPKEIAARGSDESDYLSASIALAAALDPQFHDPAPTHHNAAGASLAVPSATYYAVGKLPVLQMGEDRAFASRVEAHDFRVRYADRVIVETSCRMIGRTDGGMAGALRARAFQTDPFADDWLEPAEAFIQRYSLRGQLRAEWPRISGLRRVVAKHLGAVVAMQVLANPLPPHCGAFIARLEALLPRSLMHLSDCRVQLPLLQAKLQNVQRPMGMRKDLPPNWSEFARTVAH